MSSQDKSKGSALSNVLPSKLENGRLYSFVGPCLVSITLDSEEANEGRDRQQHSEACPSPSGFFDRVFQLLDSTRKDQAVVLLGESDAGRAIASRSILHRIKELSVAPQSASEAIWERLLQVPFRSDFMTFNSSHTY